MKKKICLLLAILSISIVYSDNNIENKKLQIKEINDKGTKVYSSSLSIGVFTGLDLGYGKIANSEKYTKEKIWIIHAAGILPKYLSDRLFIIGLYHQTNYFKDPARKGFFLKTEFGIDYLRMPPLDFSPGGSIPGKKDLKFICPNLSVGGGYSFLLGIEKSFIRISIDVGIKVLICNLNLTFLF